MMRNPEAVKEEDFSFPPLVLAVNCLLTDNEFERQELQGVARFKSLSVGGGGGGVSSISPAAEALVEEATVLVLLTLQDLHPALQQRVFIPSLVILLTTTANQEQEVAAAEQFGIQRLLQVPLDTTDELADTCIALMLDLLRRTHAMAHAVQRGVWTPSLDSLAGMRKCRGLQLGLVGLGPVAMGVARRAAAFGMQVVACDPMEGQDDGGGGGDDDGDGDDDDDYDDDDGYAGDAPPEGEADDSERGESGGAAGALSSSSSRGAAARARSRAPMCPRAVSRLETAWAEAATLGVSRAESLQHLLETSDVVSLHAQANRVTAEMICEETLTWFKRGAHLVNVASGALVNAVELKLALVNGRLGGAAVDCPEGGTWLEAWVRDIPNLIVTPHIGFFSDQAFAEQRSHAVRAVRAFLQTKPIGSRLTQKSLGGGTGLVLGDDEDGEEDEYAEEEDADDDEEDASGVVPAEKEVKEGDSVAFQRL